jgi:hypothetical protein
VALDTHGGSASGIIHHGTGRDDDLRSPPGGAILQARARHEAALCHTWASLCEHFGGRNTQPFCRASVDDLAASGTEVWLHVHEIWMEGGPGHPRDERSVLAVFRKELLSMRSERWRRRAGTPSPFITIVHLRLLVGRSSMRTTRLGDFGLMASSPSSSRPRAERDQPAVHAGGFFRGAGDPWGCQRWWIAPVLGDLGDGP